MSSTCRRCGIGFLGFLLAAMFSGFPAPAAVDFSIEIQRMRNALRTEWSPGGEYYGLDARMTVTPVGATNFLHSPNTNHSWRIGPGEFGPDQILPGSGGRLYYQLDEALDELTNGVWTIVLNEGAPNEDVYHFRIGLAQPITTATLELPTITYPLDDAEGVPTDPTFTWTLPQPADDIEVSLGLANSAFARLAGTETTWPAPFPLTAGDTEFNLALKTHANARLNISTPQRADLTPLAAWTTNAMLSVRRTHQFFVGPRAKSSLIAHLKFDDAGNLGHDSSTANHPAETDYAGAPPAQDPDGAAGSSLRLVADDLAELRWDQDFIALIARGFTVSAWVKTTQDFGPGDGDWGAGAGIVAAQACCDGRDFAPLVLNGGYALFNTGDGEGGGQTISSTSTINSGEWVHLVATREAVDGRMRLYVNGQLEANLVPGRNAVLDGPEHLTVGSLGNFHNSFDGLIDDVQIYTNAISDADVVYLYEHPGEVVAGAGSTISLGDALDAPQFTWSTGGDAPWTGQHDTTADGVDAAQSGIVNPFGESWVETTVEGPGQLEFQWKLAAESGVDYLEFLMDDSFQTGLSETADWESYTQEVPAGFHTFRWRYYQTDVAGEGDHAGWLDELTFHSGVAPVISVEPFDQTNSPGYQVALQAAATGTPEPTWQWYKVGLGAISDATNALFIPPASGTAEVAGQYYAVASNPSGSAFTRTAVVSFTARPAPPAWSVAVGTPLQVDNLETPRTNYGIACLFDASGNLFAANSFTGTNHIGTNGLTAGPGRFATVLMKLAPDGSPLWARGLTNDGSGNSFPQCLAPAPGNGVYMSGVFLGTNWLGTNRLVETAGASVYLARFAANGDVLWVRTIGGTNAAFQSYHQLAANPAGVVTLSALIQNTTSFGPTNVTVSGQRGALAQFEADGTLRWVQTPSGWVQSLVQSGDRLYAAMDAGDTAVHIGGVTNLTDRRWVLAALNLADGHGVWMQGIGADRTQFGFRDTPCLAVSGSDLYAIGTAYGSEATFGPLTVPGLGRQYFVRFTTEGAAQVATTFGSDTTVPWAAAADAAGNVYVAADFETKAVFGDRIVAAPHRDALAQGFPSQMFLAKFDRNGTAAWARLAESGAGYVNIRDLAPAPDGIWACGFVSTEARFEPFTVTGPVACIGFPLCSLTFHVGGWAAKITDGATPSAIRLVNPRLAGGSLTFDFATDAGRAYAVESRDELGPGGSWQTVTNIAGDGSVKSVTRPATAPGTRYFRVRSP